ncbi:MAG TPA: hypothetical protein VFD92_24815 [Candidatus Binatia bacterium]|nr:hypothetical protein [Candidatus Binatia bacterium]
MATKAHEQSFWAPFTGAVEQASERAKDLNKQARKIARRTADELRSRSEAAIQAAQHRSERTLKIVRKNLTNAQKALDVQSDQLTRLIESARRQLGPLENELRRRFEAVARGLNLALDEDVEALRRKIASLEKRVSEIARESKAA